jgi:uncharacterized membrane protein
VTARTDVPGDVAVSQHRAARVRPAQVVGLVAALIGIGLGSYLTVEHFTHGAQLSCPETATVNCLKVTTSSYSVVAGVPVAVAGLAYFVVMAALVAIPGRHRTVSLLRLLGAAVGVVTVVYLVYVELFRLDAICLWCTGVHLMTLVLFGAVVWRDADLGGRDGLET